MNYATIKELARANGRPYENTERDWSYLTSVSKWARYLDFVPAGAFVDRRNPAAIINAQWQADDPTPSWKIRRPRSTWASCSRCQSPSCPRSTTASSTYQAAVTWISSWRTKGTATAMGPNEGYRQRAPRWRRGGGCRQATGATAA